jgi:uncharacterized protein
MSPLSEAKPEYAELVKFLISPFLELPDSLKVDCETYGDHRKVLIRVSFAGSDKGRVFGRGGRTLQAIRAVVNASAQLAQQTAHLEVYGEREGAETPRSQPRGGQRTRSRSASERELPSKPQHL